MLRRLTRRKPRTAPTAPTHPQPTPVHHHDAIPPWRGYLPNEGDWAQGDCGCAGRVVRSYRHGGGYVDLYIQVPCPTGHVTVGVIHHLDPRQIQPAQPALHLPGMETAA